VTSIIAGTARRTRAQDRFLSRLADNDRWLWRAMLAPAIFYIILLVGFPFLLSIYYSLSSATVASQEAHFVGLENFRRIVDSRTFWLSLQNTIVITIVSQFLVMVLANILATALAIDFRGKWLVRLLILLPWVAPISLGSIGWLWIFDSIYSVINWTARAAGLLGPNEWPIWLGEPTLAKASIIAVNVWRILPLATRDHPGRPVVDPARHPRRGRSGWSRVLAPSFPDHNAVDSADYAGGVVVRHHLHLH
jgi:multiple sugar transport system permease protein